MIGINSIWVFEVLMINLVAVLMNQLHEL